MTGTLRITLLAALTAGLGWAAWPAAAQDDAPDTPAAQTQPATQPTTQPGDEEVTSEFAKWMQKLREGGSVIWVLFGLSIVGVAFLIERLVMLRRRRICPPGLAEQADALWRKRDYKAIADACRQRPSTLADVVSFVVRHRNASTADLSAGAGDVAARGIRRQLQRAYPLAVVGTVAPLLGLLGTVIGMVEAFDTVRVAGLGDVRLLGGSISKALMTTMVGLIVAIPSVLAYHFIKSRTNSLAVELEEQASDLISAWKLQPAQVDAGGKASPGLPGVEPAPEGGHAD